MSIKIKSNISKRLIGRGKVSEYGEHVKKLAEVAGELSPEGGLYIALFEKSDMYLPSTKLIRDLIDLENMYSNRALQANPELGEEFSEIARNIKAIEGIVSRRRKKIFKRRKEEYNRIEVEQKRKEEESNDQ